MKVFDLYAPAACLVALLSTASGWLFCKEAGRKCASFSSLTSLDRVRLVNVSSQRNPHRKNQMMVLSRSQSTHSKVTDSSLPAEMYKRTRRSCWTCSRYAWTPHATTLQPLLNSFMSWQQMGGQQHLTHETINPTIETCSSLKQTVGICGHPRYAFDVYCCHLWAPVICN